MCATRAQGDAPDAPVDGIGRDLDEPVVLECAEETTEVPGIETEAGPERAHVDAVRSDLPENARLAERPLAAEEVLAESADALGDESVEAAYLGDARLTHSLI